MNKKALLLLIVTLAWICFIFCRSLKPEDASAWESRWVLELIQRLIPFELSEHLIRKLAHFAEFSVLGILAGLLFRGRCTRMWTGLLFAALTGVVTALCDETIQLFVSGRTGQIPDVWLDVSGAFTGALLTLSGRAIVKQRQQRSPSGRDK